MQIFLLTLLFPALPYVIWKSYSKKAVKWEESIQRYFMYALIIAFISAIMLALFSDAGTSFWEKMDKSFVFALKYMLMVLGAALAVALGEWICLKKRDVVNAFWEQFKSRKPVVFCGKYICPALPYLLAAAMVFLNMVLMFDNVLWGDEAFSVNTAEKSLGGILQVMYYWDNHPPLYYYWLKFLGELLGFSVPVCHLASLIPFTGGILLAVFSFQKKFGKIPAAFFVIISALGTACLEYNLEIRMYALAFFCVTACFYCSYRVIISGKKSAWASMVFWALCGAYTHYYALVTVGLLLFFTGTAVWVRHRGRTWWKGFLAIFLFLLGYAPWMFFLITAIQHVSASWWVTDVIALKDCLIMVFGSKGMVRIIAPLFVFLTLTILLSDSGIFQPGKQSEDGCLKIHKPGLGKWSAETFSMAVGILTIVGTVAFAYFLCFIMKPVLVVRYLYPLSAVTLCLLVIGSGRWLALLKRLADRTEMSYLADFGKAFLLGLMGILLVIGMKNYRVYSETARLENQRTSETLELIGIPGEDVKMVTNGVQHLGWTVLYHYYPENEIVNGNYDSTDADMFWYFNPTELSQEELLRLEQKGISVTAYGEMQLAKYPFYLYYMERSDTPQQAVGASNFRCR